MKFLKGDILKDARHFQIVTLSSLLLLLLFWSDFAPKWEVIALTMSSTLLTQFLFFKFLKIPSTDFRSPLITSLSLCLLFKTNLIWVYPLAGAVAMATKFLIRVNGKHIFPFFQVFHDQGLLNHHMKAKNDYHASLLQK